MRVARTRLFAQPPMAPMVEESTQAADRVLADKPTARPATLASRVTRARHDTRASSGQAGPPLRMGRPSYALLDWSPVPSSGSCPGRPASGVTPTTPLLWTGPTAVSPWPRLASSACWSRQAIRLSQVPMRAIRWPAVVSDPGVAQASSPITDVALLASG